MPEQLRNRVGPVLDFEPWERRDRTMEVRIGYLGFQCFQLLC